MDPIMALKLVEREEELALFHRIGTEALTDGRFLAVLGEAGIGKTALLGAARSIAGSLGLSVLGARASELEKDLAFGIVRQLVDPVLIARSPPRRQHLFSGAASLARRVLLVDEGGLSDEHRSGPGALHGLYWLMANLAQEGPLVLVLDDLHWADLPSLRFLHFLLRRLAGLPIMVVAAWRTGERGPAASLLALLEEEPGVVLIKPRLLSREGIAALLPEHLGASGPADLVETCHRASGGNPFYAISLLRQFAETEPGRAEEVVTGAWASVARSVLRRLEALGPQAGDLADAVAVLGEAANRSRSARLASLDAAEADAAMTLLSGAGILVTSPALDFAHPLVRSVVYDRLSQPRRGELHALAAGVLVDDQALADDIAVQLLNAAPGASPETAEALVAAADSALDRGAPDVAARFLVRALLEAVAPGRRVELLLALGAAEIRAGSADAVGHLEQALEQAADPNLRTEAALLLARCLYVSGEPRRAVDLLHSEASGLLRTHPAQAAVLVSELRTVADVDLTVRGHAHRLGDLSPAPTPPGPEAAPASLAHDAVALVMSGSSAHLAAELATSALADHRLEDEALGGSALFFITAFALAVADCYEPAERSLLRVQTQARRYGDAMVFSLAAIQLGFLEFRRGNLGAAEAEVRAALGTRSFELWPPLAQMALTVLTHVVIERGQPEAAHQAAEALGVALDPVELTTQGAILLEARGHLRLAEGDLQGAAADLLRVGECLGSWEVDNPAPFPWRSRAGLALARLGHQDRGRSLIDDELVRARNWGAPRTVSVALRASAQLAQGQDQLELLQEAVGIMNGSASLLERAYGLVDLGAALRRANRRADARPLLAEGLRLARACHADPLAHRAHTELWATGARPRTPLRSGLDALTASERRIAEMAAAGMSNPEIAQSLFVTTKTVEMHLTGAYRKLRVTNRGGLARVLGPGGT